MTSSPLTSLFVLARAPGLTITANDRASIAGALRGIAGLAHARIMTPDRTPADQPFARDGSGPDLALQLYFGTLAAAQAALRADSPLTRLAPLQNLPPGSVTHELMSARVFPTGASPPADPCLTFFVSYRGPAEDPQAWLDHYDKHHPPIMVRFPAIRDVETYRPMQWTSELPFARANSLQRNKVVFDSLDDLIAALASPVMAEMRADMAQFPPFTLGNTHFPMTTWKVAGSGN
jgi:uncharacterized protein (TIGR02118 family)